MPRTIKDYGWRRDLPDHRDYKYAARLKVPLPGPIPIACDVLATMPPVVDQGQLGSCVGNGSVALMEHLAIAEGQPLTPLSRLFVYYNARAEEGDTADDTGCQPRDAIASLAKLGICSETEWDYDITQYATKPTDQCYADALQRKISIYAQLQNLDDMLHCIASGYPFGFGFSVYDAFESAQVASTGILNPPGPDEEMVGGHFVVAIGYDQASRRFTCRNSYGIGWGMPTLPGHFTIPFDYLTNPDLASDFWTIRA